MALIEYTFGELIELYIVQNNDGKYGADSAIGINIDKEIRVMRGDSSRKELEKFYIIREEAENLVWVIMIQVTLISLLLTI